MYINPFVAGVLCTLFVEMVVYVTRDFSRKARCRNIHNKQTF